MDLSKLTPEEKQALLAQLAAEQEADKQRIKKERDNYRDLVNKTVADNIVKLQKISSLLSDTKADVFNSFSALLGLKKELYGYKDGQQSHSFTDEDGRSIEIGCRVIDRWDDTVEAGISKVNTYIESLATNEETAQLVRIIQNLLRKDAKGNLKANRVLELQKLADEIKDPTDREGVEIIRQSYKPVRSAWFIEARVADNVGKSVGVPLSITSVDFPEGVTIDVDSL